MRVNANRTHFHVTNTNVNRRSMQIRSRDYRRRVDCVAVGPPPASEFNPAASLGVVRNQLQRPREETDTPSHL